MAAWQVDLEAKDLEVAYGKVLALDCPELSLSGGIIAVIGHNGAGKSTMLKSILGLLPPRRGSIAVRTDGQLLIPEQDMAFCPEIGAVFADISVESYVRLWCRIKHGSGDYYKREGSRFIELLSLEPLLKKLGRELSKGQRRRVQTAIGFLTLPKLFLFDEPFDGLDVQKTHELSAIIAQQTSETAFIISSHRMDVVERLADRLIVLRDGKVFAAGPVSDVCRTLCGRSITISGLSDLDSLSQKFKSVFPKTLINRIGNQLVLTGRSVDLGKVKEALAGLNLASVGIEEDAPNLVDAMNYHLSSAT